MNVRSLCFAAIAAVGVSSVLADEAKSPKPEPKPAVREQTLLEEVATGMREVLRAVAPEISLPALELKLPTLDARLR